MLCSFGMNNHQVVAEMISTQSFFIVFNKFCFGGERKETVKAMLKRNLAGKRYKISWHAFVKFVSSKIERSTFNQLQVNVVGLNRET